MNYKALATIFLLALPMLMVPLATANQPTWNVEFKIRPIASKFMGPCLVSTAFPIDVYLWNDKSLTGVGVYAFDFWIYWQNNQGFNLTGFTNHIPWPALKYFLIVNETGSGGTPNGPTYDWFHLAVTAVGNSTVDPSLELGATGLFNASIVTLNFHIFDEPFWPSKFMADFYIGNEYGSAAPDNSYYFPHVSTGCTAIITNIELDFGTYLLEVGQPNIDPHAEQTAPNNNASLYAKNITVGAIGVTETVYIHLTNITGAYGFDFVLKYDPLWKQTDIQHITILPAFAPPYASLSTIVDTVGGYIGFSLMKPSEKPTICSKDIAVVKIDFVSTLEPEIGLIPYNQTTGKFIITSATVYTKSTTQPAVIYEYPQVPQDTTWLFYSGDLGNYFITKSTADLNFDGIVDIADLASVAMQYGLPDGYQAEVGDPQFYYSGLVSPTGNVDIYDIVFVAKRFGDPEW